MKTSQINTVLSGYPDAQRVRLEQLRNLVHAVADNVSDITGIEESLKWGQPSFAAKPKGMSSPVRIDKKDEGVSVYFICTTDLVERFRDIYPDNFNYIGNREIHFALPSPKAGEVLVKLATSGVNPSDVKSRAARPLVGDYVIPHSDGAGVIEAVGEGVDNSRVGERVWIWNGQWQRQDGTAAEYISVPQTQAVKLYDDITFETAACFGIPGLTAAHGINLLEQTTSDTVLVTGAASSVGHYLTQMATLMGRKVIGTASALKHDLVMEAGAMAFIDYQKQDVGEEILKLTDGEGVGAVIDMDFASTSHTT